MKLDTPFAPPKYGAAQSTGHESDLSDLASSALKGNCNRAHVASREADDEQKTDR